MERSIDGKIEPRDDRTNDNLKIKKGENKEEEKRSSGWNRIKEDNDLEGGKKYDHWNSDREWDKKDR